MVVNTSLHSLRSKIKSFKINCKKTKLSEAQLEEIRKEEMEEKEQGQGLKVDSVFVKCEA